MIPLAPAKAFCILEPIKKMLMKNKTQAAERFPSLGSVLRIFQCELYELGRISIEAILTSAWALKIKRLVYRRALD